MHTPCRVAPFPTALCVSLCISITINVYISFECLFYMIQSIFLLCFHSLTLQFMRPTKRSYFPLDFTSLKSNGWNKEARERKRPHWHVYSLLHHDCHSHWLASCVFTTHFLVNEVRYETKRRKCREKPLHSTQDHTHIKSVRE